MDGLIENIKIAGIASCVPRHTEDNMDYGNVLGEKRVKKQVKLTGIRKRQFMNRPIQNRIQDKSQNADTECVILSNHCLILTNHTRHHIDIKILHA